MSYVYKTGSVSHDDMTVSVGTENTELKYSGLDVFTLAPGQSKSFTNDGRETIVVPQHGGAKVTLSGGEVYNLVGRDDVWAVTDVLFLPLGASYEVSNTAETSVTIAVGWAFAQNVFPIQYISRDNISVEMRGAGICSRQVNNFGTPGMIQADRLIACEVLTPGGNWSSYPPHKHDVQNDQESILEELYYFRVGKSPAGTDGFGLQRVYSSIAGEIDVTVEVRNDDVVVIPFGYHGPSIAAPGHDLYYLNVMAGPEREPGTPLAWNITDDPDHAWLRGSWDNEAIDPRLPFGKSVE